MSTPHPIRLLITGGGTGGHLFPGIALAQGIQRACPDSTVLFVGTRRKMDLPTLSRLGYTAHSIDCQGLKGKDIGSILRSLAQMPMALAQSLSLIRRFKPDLAFGVGGYVTGPVILAARLLGIPTGIHEQNIVPGLANRLLGHIAQRIFVSLPGSQAYFPAGKTMLSGNPVRSELQVAAQKATAAKTTDTTTLLVLGGSQGASRVNTLVVAALTAVQSDLPRNFTVLHQTGEQDAAQVRQAYSRLGIAAQVDPFIHDMGKAYGRADLVVSRAGATTLAELTLLGKPAILIPYPFAADNHQEKNGRLLVDAGGSLMFAEAGLNGPELGDQIIGLLRNRRLLQTMAANSRRLGQPDACDILVRECLAMIEAKRRTPVTGAVAI